MNVLKKIKAGLKKQSAIECDCFENWYRVLEERIRKIELVKDVKELEKFNRLKFKIVGQDFSEEQSFFLLSLEKDVFSEEDEETEAEEIFLREIHLFNALSVQLPFGNSCIFRSSKIQTLLKQDFYGRFAQELFVWLEDEKWQKKSTFIRQIPKIVAFIYEFGRKSHQDDEIGSSKENCELSLTRLGIDCEKIKKIRRETRKTRFLMLSLSLFRDLRRNSFSHSPHFLIKDDRIARLVFYLKRGGLHFQDLGQGAAREIVRFYFHPRSDLISIAALLNKADDRKNSSQI